MWICDTCLVKNEADHKSCVCCGTQNGPRGSVGEKSQVDLLGQQKAKGFIPCAQNSRSLSDELQQFNVINRIRMNFKHEDLNHTSLFMAGSGEMEQIPYLCLDRHIVPVTNQQESLYECSVPTPVKNLPTSRIKAAKCGALHTAFMTAAGLVYTYGCNDMGALGRLPPKPDASNPDQTKALESQELDSWEREPGVVETRFRAKAISCGDNHTLILSLTGDVYITGGFKDSSGTIGIADYSSTDELKNAGYYSVPVKVPLNEPIQMIASGENHCVCLAEGGNTVYTFGSNEFCQLLMTNDDVQNPTDTDVDVSEEKNLKLLLTWPQARNASEIIPLLGLTTENANPKSGEENKSHGKNEASPSTKDRPQSYNTRSNTTKKIVPSAKRTRANTNIKDTNTLSAGQKTTKRGRNSSEIIKAIYTGKCTTFFQTKSMKVYGAGRNGQGEVGVGSNELIIKHPRELEFFRGVEITHMEGGQFFTVALVEKHIFIWGMLSYLGLPKEYDAKNRKQEVAAPEPGNTNQDTEMVDVEEIPLVDVSALTFFDVYPANPTGGKSFPIDTVGTIVTNDQQPVTSAQTSNPHGQDKLIKLEIFLPGQEDKREIIHVPESHLPRMMKPVDIAGIPNKIRVKYPNKPEPVLLEMFRYKCYLPPGFDRKKLAMQLDSQTNPPINVPPQQEQVSNQFTPQHKFPYPVVRRVELPNPVQPKVEKPEQVNREDPQTLHHPFFRKVKEEKQGSGSNENTAPGSIPSVIKKRKVKGTYIKVEELEGVERLVKYDYKKRHRDAFLNGKATEPILLPMNGQVNSIFTGSDSVFAILLDNRLYSWGSSQNYILGNGKDQNYEETPQLVPSEHFPRFKVIGGSGGSQHTVFIAQKLEPLVKVRTTRVF